MSLRTRLMGLVVLAVAAVLVVAGAALWLSYGQMYQDRINSLRMVVETAHGMASALDRDVNAGVLSRDEAFKRFADAIRGMRYGQNGAEYIFVTDFNATVVVNPGQPAREGKSSYDTKDANGVYFTREMVNLAQTKGEGVVEYHFPRAGQTEPSPKVSYAKGFAPWGIMIATGAYTDDLRGLFMEHAWAALAVVGLFAVPVLVAVGWTGHSISAAVRRLSVKMAELAGGRLDLSFPEAERGDEIGDMGRAVKVFQDNATAKQRLEKEQAESARRVAEERRQSMQRLADTFESTVGGVIRAVTDEAAAMEGKARSMTDATAETDRLASAVAVATGQTAANVQTVAAASEELSRAITEISAQVSKSSSIAADAEQQAERANTRIGGLAEAVDRIGTVVGLINSIASQTNLLALNATIEAARAGEAGKGFAVVASEVKALANQTAKATEDITAQVSAIQSATGETVTEIKNVGQVIVQINQIAGTIAAAVEEQGAATREIARNIQQAAAGTNEVSASISGVTAASDQSGKAAREVLNAFHYLSEQAGTLKREVASFLGTVRSA
ncbi:methyl-accepting chemotaxis protein [Azospirillum fermentarium]|uniref:methyl-accepting chemotaxis protein n=1 Tax=Azospirillum fermentarium TaxID=1233114 RepID=UPI002226BBD8|nr:cache domain-containing protein [Azospirillum fermentarium]MCW2247491.1 methyl-accepting chemotaxis protein [Azospirillum fermentarium]